MGTDKQRLYQYMCVCTCFVHIIHKVKFTYIICMIDLLWNNLQNHIILTYLNNTLKMASITSLYFIYVYVCGPFYLIIRDI